MKREVDLAYLSLQQSEVYGALPLPCDSVETDLARRRRVGGGRSGPPDEGVRADGGREVLGRVVPVQLRALRPCLGAHLGVLDHASREGVELGRRSRRDNCHDDEAADQIRRAADDTTARRGELDVFTRSDVVLHLFLSELSDRAV